MKIQENASLDKFLKKADVLLKNSNKILAEGRAMDDTIAFALEQWKTHTRWFREEPGKVTTEDVIKMCIEFAWASKANFEHTYGSKKGE